MYFLGATLKFQMYLIKRSAGKTAPPSGDQPTTRIDPFDGGWLSHEKNHLYWLVNRDPYNGLL